MLINNYIGGNMISEEIKYKAYILKCMTHDLESMIDMKVLTMEEFTNNLIEKQQEKCYNDLSNFKGAER